MSQPGDFTVVFEFNRAPVQTVTPDHEPWSFEDLKDGFWITTERKLCRESQGKYWIPPARILWIERR